MMKRDEWGVYGKERILYNYVRLKYELYPEANLTQAHLEYLIDYMNNCKELRDMTVEQLWEKDDDARFAFPGKTIEWQHQNDICNELSFAAQIFCSIPVHPANIEPLSSAKVKNKNTDRIRYKSLKRRSVAHQTEYCRCAGSIAKAAKR